MSHSLRACFTILAAMTFANFAEADIILNTEGVATVENFNDFRGAGFAPDPSLEQLDSDAFRVTGLSDGDGIFGGTHDAGDFARGTSTGGVATGGIYAFEVETDNFALGVQPTGSDFTPGELTVRITNGTGQTLNFIDFRADAWFFNDADRSSQWTFSASLLPDVGFQDLLSIDSPEASDTTPVWSRQAVGGLFTLGPIAIADGQDFFIRVTGDDLAGTGSRDEFAIDNLAITGLVNVPEPGSSALLFAAIVFATVARRRD